MTHMREAHFSMPPLSRREAQVLEMAAQGLANGDIAARLEVSVHAVKFHLASVYRKLGVANRTEAAVLFTRELGPLTSNAQD
jgi:ATP/maltotriose-dependent transcriptional regulator MalT